MSFGSLRRYGRLSENYKGTSAHYLTLILFRYRTITMSQPADCLSPLRQISQLPTEPKPCQDLRTITYNYQPSFASGYVYAALPTTDEERARYALEILEEKVVLARISRVFSG